MLARAGVSTGLAGVAGSGEQGDAMNFRLLPSLVVAVAFTAAVCAQDPGSGGQQSGSSIQGPGSATQGPNSGPGGQNVGRNGNPGGGSGQRGGRGFGGGAGMMMGRGLMGTVTAAAADHYTIKTDAGEVYTVHFTADTRMFKREARTGGPGSGQGSGPGAGQGESDGQGGGRRGMGYGGGNPPQQIAAAGIKVGDVINVMGDTDATAKSVNARAVALMDQQTVDQIRAMEANFGKTWLMGKVTSIEGTKITLTGALDSAPHTVLADENTEFRKRRDPITLADIQVGDTVRADGAVKDGVFTAANVSVFGGPGGDTPAVPRSDTSQAPRSGPPQ